MKTKFKLYHNTSLNFELPSHVDMQRQVITTEASDIPMVSWPDGKWCFEANAYLLELFYRGLSRRNRGGSLLVYATSISHLLRYLNENNIKLIELSDNQFSLFMRLLQGETRPNQPGTFVRDSNSVIAIGRKCLDFLFFVGKLYQDDSFIGPKGQIIAIQKEFIAKSKSTSAMFRKIVHNFWHHRSFPNPSPKNKRLPISNENIEKLRNIIAQSSSSTFQLKRRYVMLKLLEITGGRRSEIAALTCKSVYQASKTQLLEVITTKRRGNTEHFRLIPIARHDVAFLIEFIEKNRRVVIRKTCGKEKDSDLLLISKITGYGLKANTITQEIATLSIAAGIQEKSCPHMFRHRFITKLFVALIEQHQFENLDSFRKALLDTESLKQKVQEWTGHKNIASLDGYIHLAFDEITNFEKTYNAVRTQSIVQSAKGSLTQIKTELKNGVSVNEISESLLKLIEGLEADLYPR
jgi:site-specific recombinase XerC